MITREMFIRNFLGKFAVIDAKIVPADALFGHASGAARLEDVERFSFESGRNPNFGLQVAQPFVLKMREAQQVVEALNLGGRIPAGFFGPLQPEPAASFG